MKISLRGKHPQVSSLILWERARQQGSSSLTSGGQQGYPVVAQEELAETRYGVMPLVASPRRRRRIEATLPDMNQASATEPLNAPAFVL